jgi:MFS family permease
MEDVRAVLRHREFRLLWMASSASTLGDRIVFIALALYVTDIGSPTDVGLVLAANAIPLVLFVLIGGIWADRLERHRVMVATDVIRATLHGLLAVLIFVGPVPIWAIVVIEAAFGTAEAFFNPAATGLIPQTVPEDELQQANAATSVVQNAGELVGPAIATVLVLGLGAGWAFAFDALTFVISALLLSRVRPRARGEQAARQPLLAELRIGWYELRSRQWAWVVIAATSVALLLALAPFLTLGPTIADDLYGSTGVYGALTVAMGAGTVIGSLVGLRWRPRYPIRFAMSWGTIWPPAFALFALGPPLWVTTPLFVLVGFGFAMFDVSWDTSLQERIPPYALSRVSSFDWMGSLALLPLGYLLAGPLAEAFGAVEVLIAGGALAFVVQIVALITPGVWKLERLQPNSPRPASVVDASA